MLKIIAIDDIDIREGNCPHYGNCDFEDDDLCLWSAESIGETLEWVISSGSFTGLGYLKNRPV